MPLFSLFRTLAKNMVPMTNADESPTNRLTLFPIYLSLFIVSTLCYGSGVLTIGEFNFLFSLYFSWIRLYQRRLDQRRLTVDKLKILNKFVQCI